MVIKKMSIKLKSIFRLNNKLTKKDATINEQDEMKLMERGRSLSLL